MTLTPEQVKQLKQELSSQIQHLPEDQKKQAQAQIDSMSSEAVEAMLKQQQQQDVFRLIASKKMPSEIIKESNQALAVLEINPLSKGHTLVIPKKPLRDKTKIPTSIKTFTEKVSKKLKDSLDPKEIKMSAELKFGEVIIDLIPEYDTPITSQSQRKKASKQELETLAKKINTPVIKIKKQPEKIKIKKKPKEKPIKLQKRIP